MHPDDAVEVTIRNHRTRRESGVAVLILLGVFAMGSCGLCTLDLRWPWLVLWAAGTFTALFGAAGVGWLASPPVETLKLTDVLRPRPGGSVYLPDEIVRIEFGPDPQEDYLDVALPVQLCEVRVLPLQHRPIPLIASIGEAVRLRDWAVRKGVRVIDRTETLTAARLPAGPDSLPDRSPEDEPNRH